MRLALHWQILIAVLLGILVGQALAFGLTFPEGAANYQFAVQAKEFFTFLGGLFKQALKMLVVPLVVVTIIVGIMGLAAQQNFGRLGMRTLGLYVLSSALAVVVGLLLVNIVEPGISDGQPVGEILGFETRDQSLVQEKLGGNSDLSFWAAIGGIFQRLIPSNVFQAAAETQMLGLIFFAALYGFFIGRLPEQRRTSQMSFWEGASEVILKITQLVMRVAPLGIFALIVVAAAVSPDVVAMMSQMLLFSGVVLAALAVHMFVNMSLMLLALGRVHPLKLMAAMFKALLTAFSTASSSATLPVTLQCVEENAKVSRRTSGFSLPLGATINMDGTALYECVVVIFIAQAAGVDLTLTQQMLVVVLALATSIGVAGVPSASLVAITLILGYFGLPLEALAAIWMFDRLLDMCRTAVNVWGDACVATIVARLEGEETAVRL